MPPVSGEAVKPPPRFTQIIEAVSEKDARYFEQNPEATEYWRDYVPGEFWPMALPTSTRVEVVQVQPGVRVRRPVTPVHGEEA